MAPTGVARSSPPLDERRSRGVPRPPAGLWTVGRGRWAEPASVVRTVRARRRPASSAVGTPRLWSTRARPWETRGGVLGPGGLDAGPGSVADVVEGCVDG